MDDRIITIYCFCDDCVRALHQRNDPQCVMNDAEVLTTALVAAVFFRGNLESARTYLRDAHWIPQMLSKSRLNRRLHRVRELLLTMVSVLGETWKALNAESVYSIDSFPIAACDNYRIRRAKLYRDETYRGYIASKKRYFYGVKVHLLVTAEGQPVEFFLTPGSFSDVACLKEFDLDLPTDSIIYADRGYTDYGFEDALRELAHLEFQPMRKSNAKRQFPAWTQYLQHHFRKRIETTGSLLERLLPKSIHAVTALGFELKVVLFVLAVSINCL
jgi:Transposase DDE domain